VTGTGENAENALDARQTYREGQSDMAKSVSGFSHKYRDQQKAIWLKVPRNVSGVLAINIATRQIAFIAG
jgi:hypothetical protein